SSAGTYDWDFGDSAFDTTADPSHTYAASGAYYVCLMVTDSCGTDTFCNSVTVYYCPLPTAGFTFTDSGLTVNFTNTSSGGTYNWDFGDSTFDTTADPSHSYAVSGAYYVCLMVTDSCGSAMFCDSLSVIGTGIKEQDILKQIIIYPNPVSNILYIQLKDLSKQVQINVFDVVGRRILKKEIINEKEISIDLSGFEEGTYLIEFRMGDMRTIRKVIHINSQKD
ncbi:MAG: PKD domain-containing protein, partial [Bacteroidetes bacterium]|nr:PKD domain-containing protein [Bacteroidota bacterium]